MRLVYFGSGAFAVPILRSVLDAGHEVAAVVTQPDRPAGRGRALRATPVRLIAEDLKLPVMAVEKVNDESVVREILGLGARIGVVAAFGQKIGPALLEGFPAKMINAHASLLPKYRGAAPINWAIIDGEQETGVTVFQLVDRMDAGAMLVKRRTLIQMAETAEELESRLGGVACDAMRAALEMYKDTDCPPMEAQDESQATKAPKLSKRDALVDFSEPPWKVVRRINGLWTWPGAASDFRKSDGLRRERVMLGRAYVAANETDRKLPPGTILADMTVQAGDGAVRITEVKPANSRLMGFEEFARGRRIIPGDRFDTLSAEMVSRPV